jgi:hypothetical protein
MSETMLTGESRFHTSTPLGIEPQSLMTGSKGLTHWTSETVYECSEIAGSSHTLHTVGAIYIGAAKSIGATLFTTILGHLKKLFRLFLLELYTSKCYESENKKNWKFVFAFFSALCSFGTN